MMGTDSIRRLVPRPVRSVRRVVTDLTLRFVDSLSTPGLLLAALFFAGSLTPSLVPRTGAMQGVLSGLSAGAGYGVGVFLRWVWGYLELPVPRTNVQRTVTLIATVVAAVTFILFLYRAAEWQNSIRMLMDLDPVDSAQPFRVGGIAMVVSVALIAVGRLFGVVFRAIARWLDDHVPRRIANVAGAALSIALFWLVIDGILVVGMVRTLDSSFQRVDAVVEPDVEPPSGALRTGSETSLASWEGLGRRGREFVASGPTSGEIARILEMEGGAEVREPIRVYVGLNSAETIEERARLALRELLRVDAFDRSLLVLATPTGSGWVDPAAISTIEYLHEGNVATVAVQYSYLPSWLSLMTESEYGDATARAVFTEIYNHWSALPAEDRPALYLHGLSLGALNSQRAADLYDIIADPFDGALWVGPPFRSERWRTMVAERRPGSPAWLPRFRDGSLVRFMNQWGTAENPDVPWGPTRILYLQHGSDPITFFDPRAVYRPPEWIATPRAPDVSDELRWYPVVTMLQLAVDIAAAHSTPEGYGHVFAAEEYIDAWVELTDPPGWGPADVARLKVHFDASRR